MPRWMENYSDEFLLSKLQYQRSEAINSVFTKELEEELQERGFVIDKTPSIDIAALIWKNRDP